MFQLSDSSSACRKRLLKTPAEKKLSYQILYEKEYVLEGLALFFAQNEALSNLLMLEVEKCEGDKDTRVSL